jgi:ATP-dependent 26S proteasome regulatory subunit
MSATTSAPTNHRPPGQPTTAAETQIRGILAELGALAATDPRRLLTRTQQLLLENEQLRRQHEVFQSVQAKIQAEVESLTKPERHPVCVMSVFEEGQERMAEVAGANGMRLVVNVHPDVSPDRLRTGARGVLSRERNCLLSISDIPCEWKHVGQFEEWLPDRLGMLVRVHEQLLRLSCVEGLLGTDLRRGDRIGFDESCGIAFRRLEQPPRRDLFFEDEVDADFSQVGGLDRQIKRVQHCLEFNLRHPEIASRYRLPQKRGLLFWGPPGNGKTLLARCIVGHLRRQFPDQPCRFMSILGSSDYSMWLGQSEQNLRDRFDAAREAAREGLVVMFFDELDALGRQRHSDRGSTAPDRILNTFLGLTDGLVGLRNIALIGASNRVDILDTALIRPGRFSEKIHVSAPNRRGAQAILRHKLRDIPLAEECAGRSTEEFIQPLLSRVYSPIGGYAKVAEVKLSDGRRLTISASELMSGALLENVVHEAADAASIRDLETGKAGLAEHDLLDALDRQLRTISQTLSPANVKSYAESIPQDAMPVAVSPLLNGPGRHDFLRHS